MTGRIITPWPVNGDAYTVSGNAFASKEARDRSVYNMTNRRSPAEAWPGVATDDRMVFFGLQDFLRECLGDEHDNWPCDTQRRFMARAHSPGGGLPFPGGMWAEAFHEYDGLPLRIQALPEGSVFYPHEPVIQVTSLHEGFGEIAAMIEATMLGMVSCATARATVTFHLLERMRDEVRTDYPDWTPERVDVVARWMIHDFGMRASSTPLESNIFGRAHLLAFNGTDTFNAAFEAFEQSPELGEVGTSILALAHRIVQGYEDEGECFEAIFNAAEACGDFNVASYVADCFDFRTAVTKYLVPLARRCQERGRGVVVVRPDSGDGIENVNFIVAQALAKGIYDKDEMGRPVSNHLRFIQGDSMNPRKIADTMRSLRERLEVPAVGWGIFGIGGWLRQQATRDALSSAYKLAAKGLGGEPVVKLSEVREKMSVPGPTSLLRSAEMAHPTVWMADEGLTPGEAYEAYRDFYDAGIVQDSLDPFLVARKRANWEWGFMPPRLERTLSDGVEAIRDGFVARYRGNS